MLAEIGGYVGLLLGASLANLGSLNSMVLDFCFGRRKKTPQDGLATVLAVVPLETRQAKGGEFVLQRVRSPSQTLPSALHIPEVSYTPSPTSIGAVM